MRKYGILIMLFLSYIYSMAQDGVPDYYTGRRFVKVSSETYRVDIDEESCSISNSKNVFNDRFYWYKKADGRICNPIGNIDEPGLYRACFKTFSKERASCLFDNHKIVILVNYVIDAASGKVIELDFDMYLKPMDERRRVLPITPSEVCELEKNLKKYVTWEIPGYCLDAPNIYLSWPIYFDKEQIEAIWK